VKTFGTGLLYGKAAAFRNRTNNSRGGTTKLDSLPELPVTIKLFTK
jgi:hypothetical protein